MLAVQRQVATRLEPRRPATIVHFVHEKERILDQGLMDGSFDERVWNAMGILTKISLAGFKSIRELQDLELGPMNVLIGANGAGKSNLISFFKLLNFAMTDALQTYVAYAGYANSLLHFGSERTKQITASLAFRMDEGINAYDLTLAPADNQLIFTSETVSWLRDGWSSPTRATLGAGIQNALLNDPTVRQNNAVAKVIRGVLAGTRVYQFHDTSAFSPLRSKWKIDDNRHLFDHGGNLAPFLFYLRARRSDTYENIVSAVQQCFPFFGDFALEPDRLNPNVIDLRWLEKGDVNPLGPNQLSDGTLRLMALVTLLSLPPDELPNILIIDEPELGLHPAAVEILANLLRVASASSQVIVSTQSVALVNQMRAEDIIVVDREAGQSVFRRQNAAELKDWLDGYTLGELWEKNVLGGRP